VASDCGFPCSEPEAGTRPAAMIAPVVAEHMATFLKLFIVSFIIELSFHV
jgi:hypothetical protein